MNSNYISQEDGSEFSVIFNRKNHMFHAVNTISNHIQTLAQDSSLGQRWRQHRPLKHWHPTTTLHGTITQKPLT